MFLRNKLQTKLRKICLRRRDPTISSNYQALESIHLLVFLPYLSCCVVSVQPNEFHIQTTYRTLCHNLQVLSKFKNPRAIHREPELRVLYEEVRMPYITSYRYFGCHLKNVTEATFHFRKSQCRSYQLP